MWSQSPLQPRPGLWSGWFEASPPTRLRGGALPGADGSLARARRRRGPRAASLVRFLACARHGVHALESARAPKSPQGSSGRDVGLIGADYAVWRALFFLAASRSLWTPE